jgi:hypothetical protein
MKWYLLRAINLGESVRQMENALQWTLVILYSVMAIIVIYALYQGRKFSNKFFWLGVGWFVIFSMPFYFLPNHISPFYLNTAMMGIAICIVVILQPLKKSLLVFLAAYFLVSFINVGFLHRTHWVVWRAQIAQKYIKKTLQTYPSLPQGATVVFRNTNIAPEEISVVMKGASALQLYYKDPALKVIFGNETVSAKYYPVSD